MQVVELFAAETYNWAAGPGPAECGRSGRIMAQTFFLVDVKTGTRRPVIERGMDITFPDDVHGWTEILDCRHPPYDSMTLDTLLERAHGVHKHYVLVSEDQLL